MMKKMLALLMLVGLSGIAQAEMVKEQAKEQKKEKESPEAVECLVNELPEYDHAEAQLTHKKKCKKKCYCCLSANSLNVANCFSLGGVVLTPEKLRELIEAQEIGGTPIEETGQPQTLSDSGKYYLTTDLTSPVIIASDSVELNLNGHVITVQDGQIGVEVQAVEGTVISNGLITGAAGLTTLTTSFGIAAKNSISLRISGVTITKVNTGIQLDDTEVVNIDEVICFECLADGFVGNKDSNTFIQNSLFVQNEGNGLLLRGSDNLYVQGCSMDDNKLNGVLTEINVSLSILTGVTNSSFIDSTTDGNGTSATDNGFYFFSPCSNIVIDSCSSSGNKGKGLLFDGLYGAPEFFNVKNSVFYDNEGAGIYMVTSTGPQQDNLINSEFYNCVVANKSSIGVADAFGIINCKNLIFNQCSGNSSLQGFASATSTNIQFYDCIANNNPGTGNGFGASGSDTGIWQGCTARYNGGNGFLSTTLQAYSNIAFGNTTNFNGVPAALIAVSGSVSTANGWANVATVN